MAAARCNLERFARQQNGKALDRVYRLPLGFEPSRPFLVFVLGKPAHLKSARDFYASWFECSRAISSREGLPVRVGPSLRLRPLVLVRLVKFRARDDAQLESTPARELKTPLPSRSLPLATEVALLNPRRLRPAETGRRCKAGPLRYSKRNVTGEAAHLRSSAKNQRHSLGS